LEIERGVTARLHRRENGGQRLSRGVEPLGGQRLTQGGTSPLGTRSVCEPSRLKLGRLTPERQQSLVEPRILSPQERQERVADATSREARIGIARIFHEGDAAVREEASDLGATNAEKGAHETLVQRPHAGEPVEAGAAEETKKNGLHLIVCLMGERDE
jgi:hypothetical protein